VQSQLVTVDINYDGVFSGGPGYKSKSKSKRKTKSKRARTQIRTASWRGGERDPVVAKLASIIEPMKDAFFVAKLHPKEFAVSAIALLVGRSALQLLVL
jgi:hypothetical protein